MFHSCRGKCHCIVFLLQFSASCGWLIFIKIGMTISLTEMFAQIVVCRTNLFICSGEKAFVLAAIYILIDVSSFVVFTLFYKENGNNAESPFVLNLLLNHFITIIHFEQWKKKLLPWKVNSRLKTTGFSKKRNQSLVVAAESNQPSVVATNTLN